MCYDGWGSALHVSIGPREGENVVQPSHLEPCPFALQGGPVGLLLIHGFTGSPPEMHLVGDYAHRCGYTVSAPCLPGHGTTVADANRYRWQDWVDGVERALADLKADCDKVFVGGLSLGSLLALYLAAHHPELSGAIAYSPAIKLADPRARLVAVLKHVFRQFPKRRKRFSIDPEMPSRLWMYDAYPAAATHELIQFIDQVTRVLPQVQCPCLIVYSTLDPDIHPDAAQFAHDRIGSADKELVTLHNSGHGITVDAEWETVAEKTCQFIAAHV